MYIYQTKFTGKMSVFWVLAPCILVQVTDVSKVLAASIIKVLRMKETGTS
jgi:hypothetical protein